jgi:coenzyme F420-reducing hydrogenase beta subunit
VGKDKELIDNSASGGAFATFAKYAIEQKNGVAFGACMDKDFYVRHHCAQTLQELKPLLGSKYIQSDIGFTYKECKEVLEQGRYVLYSGTPCQIAGLKCYLGKAYDTLITVILFAMEYRHRGFQNYIRWPLEKRVMKVFLTDFATHEI